MTAHQVSSTLFRVNPFVGKWAKLHMGLAKGSVLPGPSCIPVTTAFRKVSCLGTVNVLGVEGRVQSHGEIMGMKA